jgi:hypothetical protein
MARKDTGPVPGRKAGGLQEITLESLFNTLFNLFYFLPAFFPRGLV